MTDDGRKKGPAGDRSDGAKAPRLLPRTIGGKGTGPKLQPRNLAAMKRRSALRATALRDPLAASASDRHEGVFRAPASRPM